MNYFQITFIGYAGRTADDVIAIDELYVHPCYGSKHDKMTVQALIGPDNHRYINMRSLQTPKTLRNDALLKIFRRGETPL